MARKLFYYIFLICLTTVLTKDPKPALPPCPANFQYLPQNLPMHCEMPQFRTVSDDGKSPAIHALPPAPGGMPGIGMPGMSPGMPGIAGMQPGMPGIPGMPPGMPGIPGMMPGMPGMPGMPPGMPMMPPGMPMGMPMLGGPPQSKLPLIVMPFYSPDPSFKNPKTGPNRKTKPHKRRIKVVNSRYSDTDSSTDTDSSDTDTSDSTASDRGRWNWKNRRSMRRRKKMKHERKDDDYLTPILQYVSKDGYVIFEKQISKGEAKNWLGDNSKDGEKGNKENLQNKNTSKNEEEDEHERMKSKAKAGDPEETVVIKYKNKKSHRLKPNQLTQQGPRKKKEHRE